MSRDDATGDDVEALLAAAYALESPDDNRELYARWADTYDRGFAADSGYIYPEQVADVFARHLRGRLQADDVVVDVGCGTGLAGEALRRHGVDAVDGVDISPAMLGRAATKRFQGGAVYRHLIEADLTRALAIDSNTYAGAISAGTFTHGHVGPGALDEIVRIVRPGGLAALGINAAHFAGHGFRVALEQLENGGRIIDLRLVDVPIYAGADMDDTDRFAHVAVFDVV